MSWIVIPQVRYCGSRSDTVYIDSYHFWQYFSVTTLHQIHLQIMHINL
ncbi:MAG: hypothetical protein ACON32_00575 [Pirellulaceae bacterium]